ncbi:MAG: hypothetical protein LAO79_20640, partial [Acidobacteriia bacterium]|nr:hypothetical protein [Terriglobia bacterium]
NVGPEEVLNHFLMECRKTYGGSLAARQWSSSNSLRVEVKEPILAESGKFRAIRLLGSGTNPASAIAKASGS